MYILTIRGLYLDFPHYVLSFFIFGIINGVPSLPTLIQSLRTIAALIEVESG